MPNTHNSVGVFTTDSDLIVQLWDDALARLTGIEASSACGQPVNTVIPDLKERRLLSRFQRAVQDGSVEVLAPAFHHYLIPCRPVNPTSSFEFMQQRVTIAPLRDGESIVGLIVTVEDVTDRIERERRLANELATGDDVTRLTAAETIATDESVDATPLLQGLEDRSWQVRRVAVRGVSQRAAPDAIASLLKSVRDNHQNPALLNSALQVLASSDVDTLSPLLEFLKGPDADLRMQAALALGEQRDIRAVPALIDALSDENTNVRYHVIEALGKLQALDAVESLVEIAETRDFFLAFPALEALSSIGNNQITSRIVPLLENELLREPAARFLGQLGSDATVAPLVQLLNSRTAPTELIAQALSSLYERYETHYGEGGYIADLVRNQIDPTGSQNLLDHLDSPDAQDLHSVALVVGWLRGIGITRALTRLLGRADLRDEIVEALVKQGPGILDLLIAQLNAEDAEVRRAAVVALGRIGDVKATPALLEILTDEQHASEAAIALGQIGDSRALDGLLAVMGSDDSATRQAAVAAINSLATTTLRERIEPFLHDSNPKVRESAIKVAGYFGYPNLFARFLELCNDPDEKVRCAAIEHLVYFDEPRVPELLRQSITSPDPKVRAAAARAMGNADGLEVISYLIAALNDEDGWVRYFSTRALARHRSSEIVPAVVALLEREEFNHIRIAALDVLGQNADVSTLLIVARFAEHDDANVASGALFAIGKVPGKSAVGPLLKALRSPNAAVRVAATRVLGQRKENSAWEELQRIAATDSEQKVAESAVDALAQIGSPESIAALIGLLASPGLRTAACNALSSVPEGLIELVGKGLDHKSPLIRRLIVEVLARMKRPRATELLQVGLDDTDQLVRTSAAEALKKARG
jgi:HEAT repeat protein